MKLYKSIKLYMLLKSRKQMVILKGFISHAVFCVHLFLEVLTL